MLPRRLLKQILKLGLEKVVIWSRERVPNILIKGQLVRMGVNITPRTGIAIPIPCASNIRSSLNGDDIKSLLLQQVKRIQAAEPRSHNQRLMVTFELSLGA